MDLLGISRDLIAADTVSHKGTAEAVAVLRPLYEGAGLAVKVQEVVRHGARHQNLLGTYGGEEPRGLLLVTHLDTVDPGPHELWTETGGNPFALTLRDDRLYGLGTADTKLDALCKLAAAREFRGSRLRRPLQLLGTFEEEVGGKGARHFVQTPDFTARFAAVSEPSELTLVRAHKGYAVVEVDVVMAEERLLEGPFERLTFEGRSAHSSTPHLGINAIEKALDALGGAPAVALEGGTVANKVPSRCAVIRPATSPAPAHPAYPADRRDGSQAAALARALYRLWQELASAQEPRRHPAFDPPECVVNWGVTNVCGPRASCTFDCRLLPGHDPEGLVARFTQQAQELGASRGAEIRVEVSRANPAMELGEPSELLDAARAACREVGLIDTPQAKATNTEAGVFAASGIEAIVFGPGRSTGNAHCPNEHNLYSQMEKAIDFYRALIRRLCV